MCNGNRSTTPLLGRINGADRLPRESAFDPMLTAVRRYRDEHTARRCTGQPCRVCAAIGQALAQLETWASARPGTPGWAQATDGLLTVSSQGYGRNGWDGGRIVTAVL